ncbi:hypothetical protein EYM_01360 [Ignicoccus islandicus DSM 13165]|uniref:Peptidase M28 domain-containing protein n=1 Tax=Ignicoccus islandicus DSM 13165 TaxID=940295 RepID=A0A0U3G1K3_9CREN|nr:hypothetical protein [Ignicoccus islandicus]ALU12204.1 hypothetical protein EYM_01360 [Ignicoccus islandicus DSM 13165]
MRKLYDLSPRLYENIEKTAEFIKEELSKRGVSYYEVTGKVRLPVYLKCEVFDERVPCKPTGFESGSVEPVAFDTYELFKRDEIPSEAAFLYNSKCPSISTALYTKVPSITVSRKDVRKVWEGSGGEIEVTWKEYPFTEVLVGNLEDPVGTVFIHYDSFGGGSVDNGAAVAITLERITEIDLSKNLIVFSAPDELSDEWPIYWGYGFRHLENEFKDVLERSEVIVAYDSIGLSEPIVTRNLEDLRELLPFRNENFLSKAVGITSDWEKLFEIYHSDLDVPEAVNYSYASSSWEVLKKVLSIQDWSKDQAVFN